MFNKWVAVKEPLQKKVGESKVTHTLMLRTLCWLWCTHSTDNIQYVRPHCSHYWHFCICPTVASRLVSQHRRIYCEVPGSQEVVACFMSVSPANCFPTISFLMGPKRWKSLGPHTSNWTWGSLWHCGWEIMDYSPYSPNLLYNNFCLFWPAKNHLACKWFATDTSINQAIDLLFCFQNNNYYYNYFITILYLLFVRRGLSPLLFSVSISYLITVGHPKHVLVLNKPNT